jgi:hypothetical protein
MCGTVPSNPLEDLFNKGRALFDNPEGDALESLAAARTVKSTTHGTDRVTARTFSAEDYALTKSGEVFKQPDGATVYLKQTVAGRYNVLVENARGAIVTAIKNVRTNKIARLATNHGWTWTP